MSCDQNINHQLLHEWFGKIDARNGLGEELYLAISQLTPSICVELIIKSSDRNSTLLTWRADKYYGPGWHVPGGVLRFKEKRLDRVSKVAMAELKTPAYAVKGPIGNHEVFNEKRNIRGHFISFIYDVELEQQPPRSLMAGNQPLDGEWKWFENAPENLIPNQTYIKDYI